LRDGRKIEFVTVDCEDVGHLTFPFMFARPFRAQGHIGTARGCSQQTIDAMRELFLR